MLSRILCACACLAIANAAALPEALHYIGVGYNMVRANPDGNFWASGGDDPGVLSTRKVLSLSSATDVPAEIVYEHHDQCRPASEFSLFWDPKSYQNKLMERIVSSGTNNDAIKSVAFTLSQGKYNIFITNLYYFIIYINITYIFTLIHFLSINLYDVMMTSSNCM